MAQLGELLGDRFNFDNTQPKEDSGADAPGESREAIVSEISRILNKTADIDPDSISESTALQDLAISSLSLIETAVRIEEAFGVRVDEREFNGFNNVADIVDFVLASEDSAPASEDSGPASED